MILQYKNKDNKFYNIKEVSKSYFHMSDKLIVKLKNMQKILLNGKTARITDKLNLNDIVEFDLNYEEESSNIVPTKMDLDIIFEDEAFLIINKPYNMPVHPSMNHYEDSLSNGIKYYFNSINLNKKIRPVNRLDKDTSGLVVFAKNEYIQENLINQMKENIFKKEYIAVLEGILPSKDGIINAPISRKQNSIIEREVNFENGQESITYYKVLKEIKKQITNNIIYNNNICVQENSNQIDYCKTLNLSLVNFKLKTGRTHQIRVHSKFIGAPILGDTLYNKKSTIINRQALHAQKIEFLHPITKNKMSFETEIPKDIQNIFDDYN